MEASQPQLSNSATANREPDALLASLVDQITLLLRQDDHHVDVCQGHNGPVLSVAISPDNRFMASGGGEAHGLVMLWDLASGRLVNQFAGHTNWVWSVAFSPNERNSRRPARTARFAFGTSPSEQLRQLFYTGNISSAARLIDTQKQWLTWVSYSRGGDELITCVKRGK